MYGYSEDHDGYFKISSTGPTNGELIVCIFAPVSFLIIAKELEVSEWKSLWYSIKVRFGVVKHIDLFHRDLSMEIEKKFKHELDFFSRADRKVLLNSFYEENSISPKSIFENSITTIYLEEFERHLTKLKRDNIIRNLVNR